MKKGISIWSFAETDLKKCFQLAQDAGFDGVEVALDEKGLVSLESTKEDAETVKAWAKEAALRRDQCKEGTITFEEYKAWLDETSLQKQ